MSGLQYYLFPIDFVYPRQRPQSFNLKNSTSSATQSVQPLQRQRKSNGGGEDVDEVHAAPKEMTHCNKFIKASAPTALVSFVLATIFNKGRKVT